MSRTKLQQGHRVRYSANGRRMRGEVVDQLPLGGDMVAIRKRKRVVWIKREELRLLP